MTKAELLTMLNAIAKSSPKDPEAAHAEADTLLLRYIDDPEIKAAFDAIEMWYA